MNAQEATDRVKHDLRPLLDAGFQFRLLGSASMHRFALQLLSEDLIIGLDGDRGDVFMTIWTGAGPSFLLGECVSLLRGDGDYWVFNGYDLNLHYLRLYADQLLDPDFYTQQHEALLAQQERFRFPMRQNPPKPQPSSGDPEEILLNIALDHLGLGLVRRKDLPVHQRYAAPSIESAQRIRFINHQGKAHYLELAEIHPHGLSAMLLEVFVSQEYGMSCEVTFSANLGIGSLPWPPSITLRRILPFDVPAS